MDFLVISLTPRGDTNWVYRYNGPENGKDQARSIVYGMDGNIYAAGYSEDSSTYFDFIVISLTPAGDTNWTYQYNGSGNDQDIANSIVYGADGNIYAAGWSADSSTYFDFIVISLTPAGDTNWTYQYNGPGNDQDIANSIVYGADGNIYTAGSSVGSDTIMDFLVISLTPAGDANWVYRYDGPGHDDDQARSIVYGLDGNIYAAGDSRGSGTNYDFIVISLTTAGDTNWVYRYNGPSSSIDEAHSIVYGNDGNIYAAGYSYNNGTYTDFLVISLTTAGDTNWTYQYNGSVNDEDNTESIVYGGDGNIYIAGYSRGYDYSADFMVISLSPDLGVEEKNNFIEKNRHGTTVFSGPLHFPNAKNCKVFDITGRQVMPNELRPGIYFIEIDGVISQKVVKVR